MNIQDCRFGDACLIQSCRLIHSAEVCERFHTCLEFSCDKRHGRGRMKCCKFGVTCRNRSSSDHNDKFLHPSPTNCPQDQLCISFNCINAHSVPLCKLWGNCVEYNCNLRHGPMRSKKCPAGLDCKNKSHFHLKEFCHPNLMEYITMQLSTSSSGLGKIAQAAVIVLQQLTQKIQEKAKEIEDSQSKDESLPEVKAAKSSWIDSYHRKLDVLKSQQLWLAESIYSSLQRPYSADMAFSIRKAVFRGAQSYPILSIIDQLSTYFQNHQLFCVKGAVGSGKSSQLPQYLADIVGRKKRVVCTTPSWQAAIRLANSVSRDMAAHLDEIISTSSNSGAQIVLGPVVGNIPLAGYKIPMCDQGKGKNTMRSPYNDRNYQVEYWTESLLLEGLISIIHTGEDKFNLQLDSVGAFVVDDIHTGSFEQEILVTLLQRSILPTRPDVRVVLTTLHSDNKKGVCLEIPRVTFTPTVVCRPIKEDLSANVENRHESLFRHAIQTILDILISPSEENTTRSGILCFVPAPSDIERMKSLFEESFTGNAGDISLLSFYEGMPLDDYEAVLSQNIAASPRRIIFATALAESAVRMDQIGHVIDCGPSDDDFEQSRRWHSGTSRKDRIDCASCHPGGIYYQLYDANDIVSKVHAAQSRNLSTKPISSSILRLVSLGLSSLQSLISIDIIPHNILTSCLWKLQVMGAIDVKTVGVEQEEYELTTLGSLMIKFPHHPGLLNMILKAREQGLESVACSLASISVNMEAFFTTDNAWKLKPQEYQEFLSQYGDVVTMFRLFQCWCKLQKPIDSDLKPADTSNGSSSTRSRGLSSCVVDSESNGNNGFADVTAKDVNLHVRDEEAMDFDNSETFDEPEKSAIEIVGDKEDIRDIDHESTHTEQVDINVWCRKMMISNRTLQKIFTFANQLENELFALLDKATNINDTVKCERICTATNASDEDLARLIGYGFFLNLALEVPSSSLHTSVQKPVYSIVKTGSSKDMKVEIHPYSVLNLLSIPSPILVYSKSVQWKQNYIMGVTVLDPSWMSEFSDQYRAYFEKLRGMVLPFTFTIGGISTSVASEVFGTSLLYLRVLEELHNCTIQYDTLRQCLNIWCQEGEETRLRLMIQNEINKLQRNALEESQEYVLQGSLRAVFSSGGTVEQLLFAEEFAKLKVHNLISSVTECRLRSFCERHFGPVVSVRIERVLDASERDHQVSGLFSRARNSAMCKNIVSIATIHFASASTASSAYDAIKTAVSCAKGKSQISSSADVGDEFVTDRTMMYFEDREGAMASEPIEVTFEKTSTKNKEEEQQSCTILRGARIYRKGRLLMSWAATPSTSTALIEFKSYLTANSFINFMKELNNSMIMNEIFGVRYIHVGAMGQRYEQSKNAHSRLPLLDLRGLFVRPDYSEYEDDEEGTINEDGKQSHRKVKAPPVSYGVKVSKLLSSFDEVDVQEAIYRLFRLKQQERPGILDYAISAFTVVVRREDEEREEDIEGDDRFYENHPHMNYNIVDEKDIRRKLQSGQLTLDDFIPLPEKVRVKSAFEYGRARRKGWYLEYPSLEVTRLAMLAWNKPPAAAACPHSLVRMQRVYQSQPVRLQQQFSATLYLQAYLFRGLEVMLRALADTWLRNHSNILKIAFRADNSTSRVYVSITGSQFDIWQRCVDGFTACLTPVEFHGTDDIEKAVMKHSSSCKQVVSEFQLASDELFPNKLFACYYASTQSSTLPTAVKRGYILAIYGSSEQDKQVGKDLLSRIVKSTADSLCHVQFDIFPSKYVLVHPKWMKDQLRSKLLTGDSKSKVDVFIWNASTVSSVIDVITVPNEAQKVCQWLKIHKFLQRAVVMKPAQLEAPELVAFADNASLIGTETAAAMGVEVGSKVAAVGSLRDGKISDKKSEVLAPSFCFPECNAGDIVFEVVDTDAASADDQTSSSDSDSAHHNESDNYQQKLGVEGEGCLYCCDTPAPHACYHYKGCSHYGCRDCLANQFHSAITASIQLPICCYLDGTRIAWKDIQTLATVEEVSAIRETALGQFLLQPENMGKYKYCPRPGCNHILRLADAQRAGISKNRQELKCNSEAKLAAAEDDDSDIIHTQESLGGQTVSYCESCNENYCWECSDRLQRPIEAHLDMTCANNLENPDFLIVPHIQCIQETILTHQCPHCQAAFVDWDGCCAVECNRCHHYFCGICFTACEDSSSCHQHVSGCTMHPNQNGSYFVDWDLLCSKVHQPRRISRIREYMKKHFADRPRVQQIIMKKLELDLRELGISVEDILAEA